MMFTYFPRNVVGDFGHMFDNIHDVAVTHTHTVPSMLVIESVMLTLSTQSSGNILHKPTG